MQSNGAEFTNIIGGKHLLTQNLWGLSLVRKLEADHAYLILEGVDDGQRVIKDAHLVVKEGTNELKALVLMRELSFDMLRKVGQGCHAYTWSISRPQAIAFIALVEAEIQRSQENKINYLVTGHASVTGSVGASAHSLGLGDDSNHSGADSKVELTAMNEVIKKDYAKFFANTASNFSAESLDTLLRDGHNCGSWAVSMIRAIQLPYEPSLLTTFIYSPAAEIRGHHDGDEPTSKCILA